ncbi:MAG: IclR family transcriptional regulator [Alicyclobacillus macrosporangiidus]|uniref:IclR family transcriptional regulator n=1 Tax=Alicyclobacillus macrosporangiidus TaxID=392015 RepID=UPI0026EF87D5|nr:IclR family transcriptional regulator [Alicyclobacillus macrosporangiidus]MCL6599876.1 IclR family transcriptional regulator [Alicyclobacillus macrosporangiidus]
MTDKTRTSQTLARGLEVLNCFLPASGTDPRQESQELGIKQMVDRLGLPHTVVSRLVATLTEYGYLQQNPATKKYHLGLVAFLLGQAASPELALRRAAWPAMTELAERTRETVSLNIVDPVTMNGVCIASIDSPAEIKLTTRVGSVRPLHRGATRKVLLAFLDPWRQEQYCSRFSDWTDGELERLRRELEQIRAQGYAYSEEELDPGAFAIAAPILATGGQLLGSIAVAGPIFRKTPESLRAWTEWVMAAARSVQDALARQR